MRKRWVKVAGSSEKIRQDETGKKIKRIMLMILMMVMMVMMNQLNGYWGWLKGKHFIDSFFSSLPLFSVTKVECYIKCW